MKKKAHLGSWDSVFITIFCVLLFLLLLSLEVMSQSNDDGAVMDALRKSIGFKGWSGSDYCSWQGVSCDKNNRVYKIQLGNQNLQGTLPPDIKNLSALEQFEVQKNQLSGDFPSFSGLSSFRMLLADGNNFSSFPADYFNGLSSLETISINNNAFSPWTIPDSLKSASALKSFSATSANLNGKIPDLSWGNAFPSLIELKLSFNNFEGELPASFSGSSIQTLWLNGLKGTNKLNGSISVIQNMTSLQSLWLHGNQLTGPIPDLSNLQRLSDLSLRDNQLTGVVPSSLVNIPSLQVVNLTNNLLQGPTPVFKNGVMVDMKAGTNSFCLDNPGEPCDSRVDILLSIVKYFNYPVDFASSWQGNDPCGPGNSKSSSGNWKGITCIGADITTVNFGNMGLVGTISSNFSMITSLKRLILFNNNIDGTIPNELTTLPNLVELDVSNNKLYGKMPSFRQNVVVKTSGNPNIGKDRPVPGSPGSGDGNDNKSRIVKVIGVVLGSIGVVLAIGTAVFCLVIRKRRQSGRVQSPNSFVMHSGNQEKIAVHGCGSDKCSSTSSGHDDLHLVEGGNMTISIHVLRNVTGNFSQENILGMGGFGTVYKGELHDGTNIAVKRMESGVVADKGLKEFKSEISVLTKVRHRHLVALLDYCLDGNEKLLVYEYMPQGTLSRFLFHWKEEGLKPLEWSRRLTIGLDVARGVEYLHGLAAQSFIHRDLKPSNILLDDDMRAKVADFGLVRLAPEGKASIETRLAGTFGYLAPEYAATGRVTTKVDVYSFGVILMELITGRKAIDESQPEESLHLVTWFRRMILNKDKFQKAIDPAMDLNEETLISITKVAQLAGHCTAREPHQRPDMGHTVNVLASLVNVWKPSEPEGSDDTYGINLDMTLPQALKKWQASGGDESSFFANTPSASDNTQSSMPEKPQGLAKTFGSSDGR